MMQSTNTIASTLSETVSLGTTGAFPAIGGAGPAGGAPASAVSRIELILQQIDALPTLSTVATRVLSLSGSSEAEIGEIVRLIESDPALTVRLLSLCRRAERGLGARITTVDRAVVMLGLDAVRSAMLSVEVCGLVQAMMDEGEPAAPAQAEAPRFDRRELWRHSVAVACASELIAQAHGGKAAGLEPSEAFVCGLLHDLGKLALDRVLPKTYARVVALCEQKQCNIAELEHAVIGLDHHTAGKRLAENWGLPHVLQDVMWLHGQPPANLPELPHRGLIGLVTVADALVRRLHLGWSGNYKATAGPDELCRGAGLDPGRVDQVQAELLERVRQRAADLGLEEEEDREVLLRAINEANRRLGQLSLMLGERARLGTVEGRVLDALGEFHRGARKQHHLVGVMSEVVKAARSAFGEGYYALLWQSRPDGPCHLFRFDRDGAATEGREVRPPLGASASLHDSTASPDWIRAHLTGAADPWKLRLLALAPGGTGPRAVLIHDREHAERGLGVKGVEALASAWAWALFAAAQHQGARKLGEQVAEANRRLAEAQSKLVESRSTARLGELAAGAAHEMNNPLAVISGQCQLLLRTTTDAKAQESLAKMARASEKLSGLIAGLYEFASPSRPVCRVTDLTRLVESAASEARKRCAAPDGPAETPVHATFEVIGEAWLDAEQIGRALTELIANAIQSRPKTGVEVRVHVDPSDDRLILSVTDDGVGMSRRALNHAFDPFFSERAAGRRTGMGLARARRLVEAHGGEIDLQSVEGQGTSARIVLRGWRVTLRAGAGLAA